MSGPGDWSVEGFHHVQVAMPSGEEARAEAFYVGLLRFDRIQKPPELEARGGCWFRSGPVELHVGVDPAFRPAGKAHPALRIRGLASVRAALQAAGWPVQEDTQLEGHDRWYVLDPFGNRLEFIEER